MRKRMSAFSTLVVLLPSSMMHAPSNAAANLMVAENSASAPQTPRVRVNPGWGNAERVCSNPRIGNDSPSLNGRGGKNDFTTGFYRIGMLPNREGAYLNVVVDGPPLSG